MARPGFSSSVEVAARRARVVALRTEHVPYAEIAAELGIAEATARKDYERSLDQAEAELAVQRNRAVAIEVAELNRAARAAWKVLRTKHITVQQGKIVGRFIGLARDDAGQVVYGPDDKPIPLYEEIEDDAPVLAAIDRIVKIAERRARLRGLDAPTKVDVSDERRAEIEKYAAELAAGMGDLDPEGAGAPPGDAEAG